MTNDINRIKRSRQLDISQEHNAFSSARIKERCPVDRLQTFHSNSYSNTDNSSKRLLKLNPFLILDTDPSLDSSNVSRALSRSPRPIGNCVFYNLLI